MSDQAPGNGSPNQPQGSNAPGAFTDAQLEQISNLAAQTANSAFSGRMKKFRDDLMGEFSKGLDPISKKFDELSAAYANSGKAPKKPKDGAEPDESTPEYKGLQRQLQEQKIEHEKLIAKLKDSEDKAQAAALRQSLAEELSKHGIADAPRVKAAIATLFSDGKVRRNDDGHAVFVENEDSLIDLATGIKAWAKTEDAKIFLPPTGARGSGGSPGQGPPKPASSTGEASAYEIGMALANQFGGTPIGT